MFYTDVILVIISSIIVLLSLIFLFISYKHINSSKYFPLSDLYDSFSLIDTLYSDPTLLSRIVNDFNYFSSSDQDKILQGFKLGIDFSKYTISKNLNISVSYENSTVPSGENKK